MAIHVMVHSSACLTLDRVHRFTDPDYADLSLQMRTGERGEVFGRLLARGQIVIHPSDVERLEALAATAADTVTAARKTPANTSGAHGGEPPSLVLVDTREQEKLLNAAIQDRLIAAGHVKSDGGSPDRFTDAGDQLNVGDRIATRHDDRDLGVADRETWTIRAVTPDGGLVVFDARGERSLPSGHTTRHVELAYASTVHFPQGETVSAGHALVGEETTAAAAYVAMTRGRDDNTAHLVADTLEHARAQWIRVSGNDRADLGPTAAAEAAAEAIELYGTRSRHHSRRPGLPRGFDEPVAPTPGPYVDSSALDSDEGIGR